MARAVARRAGAPLVFTHHTRFAEYGHYLGPLAPISGRVTDAWLAAWWAGCAAVVAPSEALATEIRDGRRVAPGARRPGHPHRHRSGGHRRAQGGPSATAGWMASGRGRGSRQPGTGGSREVGGRHRRRVRGRGPATTAPAAPARGWRTGRSGGGRARGGSRRRGPGPRHRRPSSRRGPRPGQGMRPVPVRVADRDPGPRPGRGARSRPPDRGGGWAGRGGNRPRERGRHHRSRRAGGNASVSGWARRPGPSSATGDAAADGGERARRVPPGSTRAAGARRSPISIARSSRAESRGLRAIGRRLQCPDMRARPVATDPLSYHRVAARRDRLGLARSTTVYHHPLRDRRATASVRALRCQTSRFRFPDLGRLASHRASRSSLPLGLPRADR